MEITQQIRDYAKEKGVEETTALNAGMNEMSEKFRESGAEIYHEVVK